LSPPAQSAAAGTAAAGTGGVSVRNIVKAFDGALAVDDVSLEIVDGEFLTLLGPSGCGKTTLLRMIAGFEQPTAGRIVLGGRDITDDPPERRPLNMVFQRYALFPHLNVFDNVAYGLRARDLSEAEVRRRVEAALALVDLAEFAHRSVGQLSGGQSQRVALARAVVNEPAVLLLDEPLGALDLQLRKRMQLELRAIQRRFRTTFVYVTHDQEEALAMSHRIAVMNRGRVVQIDRPDAIYRHPRTRFVASFVGESTLISCRVVALGAGEPATVQLALNGRSTRAVLPEGVRPRPGDAAALMIRPEALRLVAPDRGLIAGRLEDRLYLGATARHFVRLDDGAEAKADLVDFAGEPGELVGLAWDETAAVLVLDD
jgi:spermidine/putrescine transport system ATP-binding protein